MDMSQIIKLDYWMILPLFIIGSTMHFVYEWSRHNRKVAIIAAVNESYWEHIKIAFWPLFILYIIEFALGGWRIASFIPAKTIALYVVVIFMISSVFAYKHFTKRNILALDIGLFGLTITIAQILGINLLRELSPSLLTVTISMFFLIFIVTAFVQFTLKPPTEPDIFKDPITNKYGLKGHK
jgi:surface polysaccharide O-acyltransferase-like enzyme